MSVDLQKRLIAFAIGLVAVTAGVFAWRAGQIGSTANYDDRQSIGQEIDQQTVRIEVAVEAARQARQYDRYVAEYAVADTLPPAAAEAVREEATARALASGVFGVATVADPRAVTDQPRPFDLDERLEELTTAATTGLTATGSADPQVLADAADDIRARVRALTHWGALLLVSAVLFTTAEVTASARVRLLAVPLGAVVYGITLLGGLLGPFAS